jgi:hypothetical protein
MNRLKHLLLICSVCCVAIATLTSCNEYLDKLPDNRTDLDSDTKIAGLLVSAYPDVYFAAVCEWMSDNTDRIEGFSAYTQLQEETANWRDATAMDYDSPYAIWQEYYKCIAACNTALQAIGQRGNPPSLAPQRGEALVCRAWLHFVLVNLFSMVYNPQTADTDLGIPYMKDVETTVSPHYKRCSVAETYRQIQADLEEGLPLIDDNAYDVPKYHFNRRAAQAFACRFWLYYVQPDKSNFRKAIDYADQVLTDNPADMLRDWRRLSSYNMLNGAAQNEFVNVKDNANLLLLSTYSLWQRQHYDQGLKYGFHNITLSIEMLDAHCPWGCMVFGGRNKFGEAQPVYPFAQVQAALRPISPKLYEMFEYEDMMSGEGYPHVIYPVLQTDETLLNRAEAYTLIGELQHGLDDLDLFMQNFTVTTRKGVTLAAVDSCFGDYEEDSEGKRLKGMKYYTNAHPTAKKRLHPPFAVEHGTQESMIHCILDMRRLLTLHEGLRWFDIKRYGLIIYRRGINGWTYNGKTKEYEFELTDSMLPDDPRRALQLPSSVINAGLAPNPR